MSLGYLAGQVRARQFLERALSHPSHAYMFVGPAQTGKRTAARLFAQALECTSLEAPGCGHCAECRAVLGDFHPDVRLWDVAEGEKTFKVEQVRELISAVALAPYQGKRKVHVLAALDALNVAGANALLKTLEEPPPATTLILLARDVETVLPTLVSRCQVVPFGLTPPEAIASELQRRFPLPPASALALAHAAQGRMGRALELAGEPPREEEAAPEWPEAATRFTWADAHAALTGPVQLERLDQLLAHARDVILLASGAPEASLRYPERLPLLSAQTAQGLEAWLAKAEALEAARAQLGHHANPKLTWDNLARALSS